MNILAYLRSLAAKLFHHSQVGDDMEEELCSPIQQRGDDLEDSGLDCLDRAEAERRAGLEFSAQERSKEDFFQADFDWSGQI
jgi:hypothetical protein